MDRWIVYARLSMAFAGVTSVVARQGLTDISSDLGLAVRTCFVFALVLGFAALTVDRSELAALKSTHFVWLGLTAATTTASWVFYYKSIKQGEVSSVAVIDKGSFVVAVLLAWLVLGERLTLRVVLGIALVLAGLLIASKRGGQ